MQQGCRLSHGIVAGGIVANWNCLTGECTQGQQECPSAADVVLAFVVRIVKAAIVFGGRLQQSTHAKSTVATVLFFIPAWVECRRKRLAGAVTGITTDRETALS